MLIKKKDNMSDLENNDLKNKLTSIIILNYNGAKVLHNCIESIYKTTKEKFEIIVIDNNSIDNSHNECKKQFPGIVLIENSENTRRYRRKWMELEEVSFKEIFNGECLEVTVPIAGVQYYCRFRLNNDSEEKILNFLDNKIE